MATDGIVPVMPVGNCNDNNGWGGNGWGALVGGAVGAWAGSAWNGNRWNGNGCNGNVAAFGETFIMDNLSGLSNNVNSIGRDQMLQTAGIQNALCQGFAGVNATVNNVAAQAAQNQSRTEAAVLTTGLQGQIQQKDNTIFGLQASHQAEIQGMQNAFALQSAISNCCCETNRNIERQGCETRAVIADEGCKTRALIEKIERDTLLRENCADKAKIAQLEGQQFSTKLNQEIQTSLGQMLSAILAKLPATTATAPAAS